jgi:hypothetical protein
VVLKSFHSCHLLDQSYQKGSYFVAHVLPKVGINQIMNKVRIEEIPWCTPLN